MAKQAEVIKLSNGVLLIQAKAPAPLTVTNNKSKKVINYGENNNYPQELLRAVNRSSYASACLSTFINYMYGDGLTASEDTQFSRDVLRFLYTPSFLKKILTDYCTFGGMSIHVRYDMNKKIAMKGGLRHQDFSTVRLGNYNEDTYEVRNAWISENWEQSTKKEFKPKEIPLYDMLDAIRQIDEINQIIQEGGELKEKQLSGQLLYTKQYKSGEPFYPSPAWSSALNWIYCDGEIASFHANNIDNAFMPSTIIFHPGVIDGVAEDGRPLTEVIKESVKEFQGAENAGKIFNLFGDSKATAPEVIPFDANSNSDLFTQLGDIIDKKIVSAFKVPRVLAGIETPGALGSTNEIANAIEWYNSVIRADLSFIETELNELVRHVGGWAGEVFTFAQSKPIAYLDPAFLTYLDEAEIRKSIGFPESRPAVEGDVKPQAQKILEALNSMSPLVANKVLDKLTDEEIRELAGVTAKPTQGVIPQNTNGQ